ncbi:MAG: DUF2029 domain-containing protein [Candidatus Marinimicrobia bacterium]|nr:DUF2029 domain-containing protein [Candidatus Neomarinimicrobiota bacterium]
MKSILESPKLLLLLLVAVSLVTINPRINGWNEASRMALTQSLVEHHTFVIDESVFVNGGDKVFINGHFYSDKPALPSVLAAIIYAPLHAFGLRLDYSWNLSYYFILLFTIKALWIASILAFRKVLTFTPVRASKIPLLLFIYAFSSLTFTWSVSFNNHSLAASSLMIAFMFYLQAKNSQKSTPLFWSGLFFGFAAAADIPTGVFLVGFAILIFLNIKSLLGNLMFWVAALLPMITHLVINYTISDSILPVQIFPEHFTYDGSPWDEKSLLSGVGANSPLFTIKYAVNCLFGERGFLWYNPLLFIFTGLLYQNVRKKQEFQHESLVIIIAILVLMSYYFIFSSNFGGDSYSIRWFVPCLPFIFFYSYDIGEVMNSNRSKFGIYGLIFLSTIIALIGAINPWSNHLLHPIPLIANIKQLAGFLF